MVYSLGTASGLSSRTSSRLQLGTRVGGVQARWVPARLSPWLQPGLKSSPLFAFVAGTPAMRQPRRRGDPFCVGGHAATCDNDHCDYGCQRHGSGPGRTSLDPPESSAQTPDSVPPVPPPTVRDAFPEAILEAERQQDLIPPPAPGLAYGWRHSGWHPVRRRVYAALQAANVSQARLAAFATCGTEYFVLRSTLDPGLAQLACRGCRDRFCLPCGQSRSRTIAANTLAFARDRTVRFFTFTLRATPEPLTQRLKLLYDSWKRLRRTVLWQSTQNGGVTFLEIKRGKGSGYWHPHLHVVCTGGFCDHRQLSQTWKVITGGSHIVDVRLARDTRTVCAYVAKYASKPLDPTVTGSVSALAEAIHALRGKKTVEPWGTWRRLKTTAEPSAHEWEYYGSLREAVALAASGDATALLLLASAAPELHDYLTFGDLPEHPPNGPPPLPRWKQLRFAEISRDLPRW